MNVRHLLLAFATLAVAACGGSASTDPTPSPTTPTTPAGQSVVVVTSPTSADVEPGATVRFGATVTGTADTGVTWTVSENGGGTIDATGLYTAPATEGTYHVVATSTTTQKSAGSSVVKVKKQAQAVGVAVDPAAATVQAGHTLSFAAAVTGAANGRVTWSVEEASGCGSVTSGGVYTAPGAAATCHVVATSQADATKSASAVVTVTPPISVAISPAAPSVRAGGTLSFSATVSNTTAGQSAAVTWSVSSGGGTINASTGAYTAPATAGTYVVTATSVADTSRSATTSVVVTPAIVVAISPAAPTVLAGGTVAFTATVTNTASGESAAVTWSVSSGGGTINASTGAYTAPATAGTYVVTATSVADTSRKATVNVVVTTPAIAVSVSPTAVTLDACKGQVFTATVSNTSNNAVVWSVVEAGGGTVTNGAYIAPSTAGTYHVMAVSQADGTKTAQATVTVGPEKVLSVAVNPTTGSVNASASLTLAASVTTTCATYPAQ